MLYVYYITSAMTSYTPTCWKQSFHQHNSTIKFLQIHIDFVFYPTGFTSPQQHSNTQERVLSTAQHKTLRSDQFQRILQHFQPVGIEIKHNTCTLYVHYITSAMTSYTPTCRKQSFQQHNTTIKFQKIQRDFVIHPTGFTSPQQ